MNGWMALKTTSSTVYVRRIMDERMDIIEDNPVYGMIISRTEFCRRKINNQLTNASKTK
jgi:hypothetical protein